MRILLVHNHYGSSNPSGENQAFHDEGRLLRRRVHEVCSFERSNDEIRGGQIFGLVRGALSTPWNLFAARDMSRIIRSLHPDVVHVHNTFPLISPAVFHAIGPKFARVLTLHNYRLFCPAAILMREGKVCTECLDGRSVRPSLLYGCYRGSRMATLPLAVNVTLHRLIGTWTKQVDAFIALTEFQRERMIEAGLPADLVHVKPHFYPGDPPLVPWCDRRPSVVFAGRLTAEKGVETLVRAWLMWGPSAPELRMVGNGGMRGELERVAATARVVPIRFLGQMESGAAHDEIAHARMLVLPSECLEGFPMVVREAFAFGTPAAVSNIGPLPSIVQQGVNGVVFSPGDPHSLLQVVRKAWESADELERLGVGARHSFETLYTEEANYRMLMAIYKQSMEVSQRRRAAQ